MQTLPRKESLQAQEEQTPGCGRRCLFAPHFYQGGGLPHSCLWKLPPNVRICRQMAAARPHLLLLPRETCLLLTPRVLWVHAAHFSVNGDRGLRMQQFRISGHNGVSF